MVLKYVGRTHVAIFTMLLLSCGTIDHGASVDSPAEFTSGASIISNSANCFGLDQPMSYFASNWKEPWIEGSTLGQFTLANAFNFALLQKHATKSSMGKVRMDLSSNTLLVSFYDGNGTLILEARRKPANLMECNEDRTKISFEMAFAGDGARSKQQVIVSLSMKESAVLIETSVASRTGWLFLPQNPEHRRFWGVFRGNEKLH